MTKENKSIGNKTFFGIFIVVLIVLVILFVIAKILFIVALLVLIIFVSAWLYKKYIT